MPKDVREIKKFDDPLFNELYQWSFVAPFKWFVDDENRPTKDKNVEVKRWLVEAGWDRKLTLRSYMTLKVFLLFGSFVVFLFWTYVLKEWHTVARLFTGTEMDAIELTWQSYIKIGSVCLAFALLPDFLLKNKAKKVQKERVKDIPILQMFIILMLRSGKTIADVLFALSKLDTPHKDVFVKGYYIYARNRQEGIDFLIRHFEGTRFVETFYLLRDMSDYSRQECIRILEDGLTSIVEEINQMKRRNDLSRLIYSQASMMVPFAAILLLGALPFITMGLEIFARSFIGGGM